MIEVRPAHRDSRIFAKSFYVVLILIAAIYYIFLVTDGSYNLFKPLDILARSMTFNSMLEHLLRAEFDVDPATIDGDGFLRDGKTFMPISVFYRHFYDCH
jgi:hypothetical protein